MPPGPPLKFMFQLSPGHGEIFENQYITLGGVVPSLLIEAIPGGALEPITRMRYEDDPARFDAALLDAVLTHAPLTAERVARASFGLAGPRDYLIGAVTPVVRRAYAPLGGGRFALALGDLHITHDPTRSPATSRTRIASGRSSRRPRRRPASSRATPDAAGLPRPLDQLKRARIGAGLSQIGHASARSAILPQSLQSTR
jgi:hypothetical protein